MRKIVVRENPRGFVPLRYYFPDEKVNISDDSELKTSGYRPSIICDLCKMKNGDKLIYAMNVVEIDTTYVEIIQQLKANGLLSESYPRMCCLCYTDYKKLEGLRCRSALNTKSVL
jgi:hypothetical protein